MRALGALAVLVAVAGCGSTTPSLPTACTEGPGAIVKALANAPGAVAIDGATPISRCFNRNASPDDVQIVGTNLLAAAQQLGDRARGGERGAALELGYLIGAARRGARRNGLGTELIRRLEAEPGALAVRSSAYKRGLRAGLATG